jgi:hypothetical protein
MFDAPIYICVQNTAFRIVIGITPPFCSGSGQNESEFDSQALDESL